VFEKPGERPGCSVGRVWDLVGTSRATPRRCITIGADGFRLFPRRGNAPIFMTLSTGESQRVEDEVFLGARTARVFPGRVHHHPRCGEGEPAKNQSAPLSCFFFSPSFTIHPTPAPPGSAQTSGATSSACAKSGRALFSLFSRRRPKDSIWDWKRGHQTEVSFKRKPFAPIFRPIRRATRARTWPFGWMAFTRRDHD